MTVSGMPTAEQILAHCAKRIKDQGEQYGISPRAVARDMNTSVAAVLRALDSDRQFMRLAGPNGWMWTLDPTQVRIKPKTPIRGRTSVKSEGG